MPEGKVKVQESIDVVNYEPARAETIELESRRTWLTDVYSCVYFYSFVQKELAKNFTKRVMVLQVAAGDLNILSICPLSLPLLTQIFLLLS